MLKYKYTHIKETIIKYYINNLIDIIPGLMNGPENHNPRARQILGPALIYYYTLNNTHKVE